MKVKKIVSLITASAVILSPVFAAEDGHKHIWIDDIEHSTHTTNMYYCKECGETKAEDVNSVRDYIVTFDANGGIVETKTLETRNKRLRKLPIPERGSDYQWDGWFTEKKGGEEVDETWEYEEDTTLYARWSVVGEYTLTFASDGGSYIKPITEKYGSVINLESYIPTKEGYIFDGWYSDPRTKADRVNDLTLQENTVVYAKWIADENAEQPDTLMTTDPIYLTDEQLAERTERIKAETANQVFEDVRETDWFSEDVKIMLNSGIMSGTDDTKFSPELSCERGMIVTVLYRMEATPTVMTDIAFIDVEDGQYYTAAVKWAAANSIVKGYENNEFRPNQTITRQELAAILYRYAIYKNYETSAQADIEHYVDITELEPWANTAIRWAIGYGIMGGTSNTTLEPTGTANRAELAAVLNRFIQKYM